MNASAAVSGEKPVAPWPLRAVLLREIRSAILNRYVQVASSVSLAGGIGAVALSEDARAVAFVLLQFALYFVSLFAVLAGVSSARSEALEWPILMAQPIPRWVFVAGKFLALLAIFGVIVAVLVGPAMWVADSPSRLFTLAGLTLCLAAVFGAVGIYVGLRAEDRAQGLVFAVTAWLFLLFGYGLATLFLAQFPFVQKAADLWVVLLMLNPADAFRIQALFAFEQIPPESASKTPVAQWWLANSTAWSVFISIVWSAVLLHFTTLRLLKRDVC